jgi:hypothetical protein
MRIPGDVGISPAAGRPAQVPGLNSDDLAMRSCFRSDRREKLIGPASNLTSLRSLAKMR